MLVKFFATYRDITRTKAIELPAPETVGGLLGLLCERFGEPMRKKLFFADGSLTQDAIVLVNGRHFVHTGLLDTPIAEGDVVSIFPMVAGG